MAINLLSLLDETFSEKEKEIIRAIVNKKGELRSTKPKNGVAAYVWRTLGFVISQDRKMQCMPVTADFGITEEDFAHRTELYVITGPEIPDWNEQTWKLMNNGAKRNAFIREELDPIVDKLIKKIDLSDCHGLKTWGRALGYL